MTNGSCAVCQLNTIVPDVGHESIDRVYQDIHEISPVTVILMVAPVLAMIFAGMVSRGAVLSIL